VISAGAAAPGRRALGQLDFALLSAYWVAIGYLWQSLGTLLIPDLVQTMVGSAAKGRALSVLEGIGTLMAVVWQPLAGSISDRTRTRWGRRRPFIAIGTAGDLLFLTGLALAGSYVPLLVFYFLLQAASNTAQGPYQGLLPDAVPEKQRGEASGYYGVANLVGILLGTVVAGFVQAHFGRGAAFASIAFLLAVTALLTLLLVPDAAEPDDTQFSSPWAAVRATFTMPLGHPDFMWLMASRLLILMGIVGVQSFALFYFSDVFFHGAGGRAVTATYTLLGLVILLGILATWPAARLSDRVGRRPLICGGGLLAALGVLAVVFSHFRLLPSVLLAPMAGLLAVPELAVQVTYVGVLVGVGLGVFLSVDWAFITDVIPLREAGLFMGFSNIATAGAGIVARFIAGFTLDFFNGRGTILGLPGGYPVVFGLFCAWLVLGSFLVLKVRRR
jgi:MFS family permease